MSFIPITHNFICLGFCSNIFRSVMSYNRFALLNRFVHLSNNEDQARRGEANYDPWYKVRVVLDSMNRLFKMYFTPYRLISIDESLIGMQNRCVFIQYLPNKRHARFGVKKFELCDSVTGYVQHIELYSGRDFQLDFDEPQAIAVVKHLLGRCSLLHKGYHLCTDNFYTKVSLAEDLL